MSSLNESLLADPATSSSVPLTGKARAKARSENWKLKQNERFMEEQYALRTRRLFPHLSLSEIEDLPRQCREIEARMAQEQEAERLRESHSEFVEPIIEPDVEEFQTISLPAVTVPLTSSVYDIYNNMRQRVGPSLSDWCPPESLYRFSQAQFLFFIDPSNYPQLAPAADFPNFDCVVRCIQLNAHYYCEDYEIIPYIDHLNPRCITLESVDKYRRVLPSSIDAILPSIIDYDLTLIRATNRDGKGDPLRRFDVNDAIPVTKILPDDYSQEDLMADAKRVLSLLKYVLPSDTEFYRPRKLFDPLLPNAPYLAILNQLPIRELARRVVGRIPTFTFPSNSQLTFPLEIRILGSDGYIFIMDPSIDDAKELSTMVRLGDLPSGSQSAWDGFDSDDD